MLVLVGRQGGDGTNIHNIVTIVQLSRSFIRTC